MGQVHSRLQIKPSGSGDENGPSEANGAFSRGGRRAYRMRRGDGKLKTRNKASPCNRSLDMATLECMFSRHNVLNDHSHSANVIAW